MAPIAPRARSIFGLDLFDSFGEGTYIETPGLETFFTILVLIYLSLDVIILGYLKQKFLANIDLYLIKNL